MSDIADRLGVTKAALYRHVTSKTELLHAVTAPVRTTVLALLPASVTTDGRHLDTLAALLRELAGAAAEDPPRHALFWGAHGMRSQDGPDAVCREAVLRRLVELLERAVAQGDVRADIEPRVAARLLLGAVVAGGLPDGPRVPPDSVVGLLLDGPVRGRLAGLS
jgi:AcrR family transcriptional regulator